jgi:hypothetical protein
MDWIVRRGHKIRPSTKAEHDFFCELSKADVSSKKIEKDLVLYACSDDSPATRCDPAWKPLGKLKMDLTDAAMAERKRLRKASGNNRLPDSVRIEVKVTLSPGSDKGTMQVAATAGKKPLGNVIIEYAAVASLKPLKSK